ncbi:universal stress protein [Plebeiibacterium sediminum]|uniref:Universal stress protein n=1 Tax=Plebeiibacterium sediminum TaxID=2992112 RepID=A0AAE3M8X9_9BACT|nr:universal stress protein [Plebeiobacterium sediminum]MCW3789084.1 universal stress protein [Plebeiobacterium sediminum]
MYIRFLIPINFEPYTLNAINYSSLLAEKFQGEITLLHVFTPYFDENEETDDNHKRLSTIEDTYNELENIKDQTIKDFNNPNITIKTKVIEGYPEDAIPLFCTDYSPDLIVMGTKSKGETIKELLGSVTLDIIRNVNFPVLAVPTDYDLNLNKLNNILFLTDFCKGEYTSLHKLVRLTMSFNTVIHNVQYHPEGKEKADVNLLNEYLEYCATTYRNQKMEAEFIYGDDVLQAATEYIKNTDIDLLAITRKKRNVISKLLHPSITKTMLFNIDIPMLFFHQ